MPLAERIVRLAAIFLGISSTLLILAAGNLFFAAWTFSTRHEPFWVICWTAAGIAFVAYGVVSLLDLGRRIAAPAMELMRPLLKLGAIALALTGVAWAVQTEILWERTGDFEAYGVVIGLIMAVDGTAAFWWLERPRPEPAPRAHLGA